MPVPGAGSHLNPRPGGGAAGSVVAEDHLDGLVFVLVEQAVRLAGLGEIEPGR